MARLLVTGASGFIGRAICSLAADRGHDVVGVSRSGAPDPAHPGVEWIAADVFEPEGWNAALEGTDAVVHSIGIIEEHPDEGITFERLNGDSVILVGEEAVEAGVPAIVFLSASVKPPGADESYLTAKRRAERALLELPIRSVALRPGPVYGDGQPHFPEAVDTVFRALDSLPGASALGGVRPLAVETVARAALDCALDPDREGVIDVETMATRYDED
jgi:uncharacterized protein YbjT (DUF2867 family)